VSTAARRLAQTGDLEPNLPAHLDYLRLRNQRPRSIRERHYAVLRCAVALGHPVAEVTRDELAGWQAIRLDNLTAAGVHNETVHVREYLRWLVRAGHRAEDPSAVLVRQSHLNDRLPRPMSDADIACAMHRAPQPERAWIALGAFAGLRCMEIAGLAREDVLDAATPPVLRITGKGGRTRVVPLSAVLLAELEDAGLDYGSPRAALFSRMDGAGGPPSAGRVSERIRRVFKQASVNGTAHMLRHRFGTELYRATGDIALVATVMGHKSMDTTRLYTLVSADAAAAPIEAISRLGD
jgi:site-specific recombinase XerD